MVPNNRHSLISYFQKFWKYFNTWSIKYSIGLSASSSAVSTLTASDQYCHSSVIINPVLSRFRHHQNWCRSGGISPRVIETALRRREYTTAKITLRK